MGSFRRCPPAPSPTRILSATSVRGTDNNLPTAILDALMGYISTFFHGRGHARASGLAMNGLRTFRTVAGRRHFHPHLLNNRTPRRDFNSYFVTHLPSSSLHPDSRSTGGIHKLPRAESIPHTPKPGSSPAVAPPYMPNRDLTVVRIPLRSAKHHYGVANSRGQRVYNEDAHQAGTISMPAFARRPPMSLVRSQMSRQVGEGTSADSAFGDPQVFYFGVFDGHGGLECSEFLRDELHGYLEETAATLGLQSSLKKNTSGSQEDPKVEGKEPVAEISTDATKLEELVAKAVELETELLQEYRRTVGGYFRRFKPSYFNLPQSSVDDPSAEAPKPVTVESVLTYAFLRADLDFITAQARKPDPDDPHIQDTPLNKDEILGSPHLPPSGHGIGGPVRFKGGSTASVALISTPTPAPFWHPASNSTLVVGHVGDTRILLCETATGQPHPLTTDHHPSAPGESRRLRRFAESITDSFGEERIEGLANSRAFGDMQSKRIGVSAEPDISRVELGPAQYSFLVLVSDGVSGTLSDQEIVDVIKEGKTPEEGAKSVVDYATEVSSDGDNATCLVVRLGGWERRSEGGVGSLGTREMRDARRAEALDPRRRGRR